MSASLFFSSGASFVCSVVPVSGIAIGIVPSLPIGSAVGVLLFSGSRILEECISCCDLVVSSSTLVSISGISTCVVFSV